MGYGTFNTASSSARATMRMSTGTSAFTHDAAAKAGLVPKLHPSLNLSLKPRRECRDNADNPNTTPIGIIVDVTGSMGMIAGYVIDSLHKMVGAIRDKGVVEHPSILFGAVGDAYSDEVPVQIGEFESSDELAEKHLSNIYREGGGGGQNMESYDLPLWFFANSVDTDAWDVRGEKGFLFVIGDEAPYPGVRADQVQAHCGVLAEPTALNDVVAKASERWEVFVLRPGGTACFSDKRVRDKWTAVLSEERVMDVPDWNDIVPTIAGTISVMSGLSLSDTLAAIHDSGLATSSAVSTALASVANSAELALIGPSDLADADGSTGVRL